MLLLMIPPHHDKLEKRKDYKKLQEKKNERTKKKKKNENKARGEKQIKNNSRPRLEDST